MEGVFASATFSSKGNTRARKREEKVSTCPSWQEVCCLRNGYTKITVYEKGVINT